MIIKGIIDEDFVNYKKPAMVIISPYCTFKCDKECGRQVCQNGSLAKALTTSVTVSSLVYRYLHNPITEAVVFQGLEPMDSFEDVLNFIAVLRLNKCMDDVVIYTGYNKDEISDKLKYLQQYSNIIIKYGRFIPGEDNHYDPVLGVNLASDNQYAEVLQKC